MKSPLCICDEQTHHHECPRAGELESVESIAEQVFPKEVAAIRGQHIDADRIREDLWAKECQESGRLNRRGI